MKKVLFLLLAVVLFYALFKLELISFGGSGRSMSELENTFSDITAYSHEKLYNEEVQKIAFRLGQEPYVQLNQRYSRKMLVAAPINAPNKKFNPIEQIEIKTDLINTKTLQYTVHRLEQSSGTFQQAKIYATVNGKDKTALHTLCREIREQYSGYNSLVICLYNETETGFAMAKGENEHFSDQEIMNGWLVFYSYHPVEGDYFDDEPGIYLKM